jgi:hypothetical protein
VKKLFWFYSLDFGARQDDDNAMYDTQETNGELTLVNS